MKRILFSLLGMMLIVCSANAQILKGDMNGDGQLNVSDITALVNSILTNKKEYDNSDITNAKNLIEGKWYNTKIDCIDLQSVGVTYDSMNYSKYAYYPALNIILLYGSDGSVKNTLIVKEKTDESMTLILPNGKTKTYYTTCPPAPVESITLTAGSTSLYVTYTTLGLPAETTTISTSVLPDYADNKEVEWSITQDFSTTRSISKVEETGNSITVRASRQGGATITATAKDGSGVSASIHIDAIARPDYQAVDLGIGVKWATMNVGANAPEEEGRYYAWGETSAYGEPSKAYPASFTGTKNLGYLSQTSKKSYGWATYKYCSPVATTYFTKYCLYESDGAVDNLSELELEDDAARMNMGGDWRMPTRKEFDDLKNKCYWQWVTSYNGKNVSGYVVYKVKDDADKGKYTTTNSHPTLVASYSLADTHIFLPVAGSCSGTQIKYDDTLTTYWLSTLDNRAYIKGFAAYVLGFNPASGPSASEVARYFALPVRAVCE